MPLLEYAVYMPSVIADESAIDILRNDRERHSPFFEVRIFPSKIHYIRTKLRQSKSPRSSAFTKSSAVATLVANGML